MKTRSMSSGLVLGATLLAGCASSNRLARARGYGRKRPAELPAFAWSHAAAARVLHRAAHERREVMAKLKEKGYIEATGKADCRVTYVLEVHERPGANPASAWARAVARAASAAASA